jgi:type I restriction enzyme S subunit
VETLLATLTNVNNQDEFAEAWQRIADHFDMLFTTEHSIEHLKQTILQLAVMGKLVPQDPNDEPGSVLLKKIANEKARLIKEGKIKKQVRMTEIRDDENPFELPEGWIWQRLGNIGYTQTGGTPSKNNENYFGNDVPFIKPGDIYPTHVNYSNESLSFAGQEALGRTAPSGSILMVCIGTIGKCNFIDRDSSFNQQINSISPHIDVTKFLLLTLRSNYFQTIAWERSSSTTIAILNKGKWMDIVLPIPPLAEQHRIVNKVDELIAVCDTLTARLNEAQAIKIQLADAIVERAVS